MVMSCKISTDPKKLTNMDCSVSTCPHYSTANKSKHYAINQPPQRDAIRANAIDYDRGFTLIELIITVLVLSIIIGFAAPAILSQLANMEAKRIRYTIINTLAVAKAESLIRRKDILVCLSDNNSRCNKNSSNSLLLFIDNNDNKHFDVGTDLLIEQQRLSPKYATLHLRAGSRHHTKFFADSGKPRGHFGHIKYCPNSKYNQAKYQISFNQVGIVKYKPDDSYPTECDE